MSKKPRRTGCSRKLSRRILLADRRALVTLQHAGDLLLDVRPVATRRRSPKAF
jgi:hypothetical protein